MFFWYEIKRSGRQQKNSYFLWFLYSVATKSQNKPEGVNTNKPRLQLNYAFKLYLNLISVTGTNASPYIISVSLLLHLDLNHGCSRPKKIYTFYYPGAVKCSNHTVCASQPTGCNLHRSFRNSIPSFFQHRKNLFTHLTVFTGKQRCASIYRCFL